MAQWNHILESLLERIVDSFKELKYLKGQITLLSQAYNKNNFSMCWCEL